MAELYGARRNLLEATPPLGTLVFYDAEGEIGGIRRNRGHAGLSLGNGRVIHAWDRVRIDECRAVSELAPAPGWTRPAPAGWVPAETMLRGSRAKEWD